ncbi:hypothetical protein R3Q06_31290 [Rhodococcus erythropolis]|uniref:hypothetical protein n=1 Tax=Rhodococcus erythropolis TaxID=1833 RepID=UPI00294A115D|nr:hypothetical protein [Rhodococcus erythropolis]MDV6277970.1 hypothetical protein [Rhodococcus erythropolis]
MQFSEDWFRQASDVELENERESIRLQYVVGDQGIEAADVQYDLLHKFDEEMVRRANEQYAIENPNPQPRHREHGWYLSNDD